MQRSITATKSRRAACFAAGTLVHTKEDLKPIEQIKVGDLVLSKHESGQGERAYKRVSKTFVHEDRAFILLSIGEMHSLAVTPEHPIWVQGKGWKKAADIKWKWPALKLELLSQENSEVVGNHRLFVTENPGIAWVPGEGGREWHIAYGAHVDIATMIFGQEPVLNTIYDPEKRPYVKPEHLFRANVYNIEVEDFHTYYVGEVGVWVHNKLS